MFLGAVVMSDASRRLELLVQHTGSLNHSLVNRAIISKMSVAAAKEVISA